VVSWLPIRWSPAPRLPWTRPVKRTGDGNSHTGARLSVLVGAFEHTSSALCLSTSPLSWKSSTAPAFMAAIGLSLVLLSFGFCVVGNRLCVECNAMMVAQSLIPSKSLGCPEVHLHCERRGAVESSFRGLVASFHTRDRHSVGTFGRCYDRPHLPPLAWIVTLWTIER
jgi:hypothetical protein